MRGRPKLTSPSRSLNTHIDESLMARVDLYLFSEVEGRIPTGSYKRFLTTLIRRFFDQKELDLASFTGELPGLKSVWADAETIRALKNLLESK